MKKMKRANMYLLSNICQKLDEHQHVQMFFYFIWKLQIYLYAILHSISESEDEIPECECEVIDLKNGLEKF